MVPKAANNPSVLRETTGVLPGRPVTVMATWRPLVSPAGIGSSQPGLTLSEKVSLPLMMLKGIILMVPCTLTSTGCIPEGILGTLITAEKAPVLSVVVFTLEGVTSCGPKRMYVRAWLLGKP